VGFASALGHLATKKQAPLEKAIFCRKMTNNLKFFIQKIAFLKRKIAFWQKVIF
jgi:hypothetical protein